MQPTVLISSSSHIDTHTHTEHMAVINTHSCFDDKDIWEKLLLQLQHFIITLTLSVSAKKMVTCLLYEDSLGCVSSRATGVNGRVEKRKKVSDVVLLIYKMDIDGAGSLSQRFTW